jgi:two-component system, NtrC family, nitrogen regulation sensor histidine kinase NtrY
VHAAPDGARLVGVSNPDLAKPSLGGEASRLAGWSTRLRMKLRRPIAGKLAMGLTVAAIASGLATYLQLSSGQISQRPGTVLVLLYVDLVLLLLLAVLVARRIVQLWAERRRGSAGAKLHVRLVVLFSSLAALPAIVVAGFSVVFFELGLQAWFSDRVRSALTESLAVAEAYLTEHRNAIRGDAVAMALDLSREGPMLRLNQRALAQLLGAQASLRALDEAVLFEPSGRVLARSGLTLSLALEVIPNWALARADAGDVVLIDPDVRPNAAIQRDRVRVLLRLANLDGIYLLVGRLVDADVVAHVERTRAAVTAYETLEGQRSGLQITFAMVFIVVALLLMLAAILVGLVFANRLIEPIGALIGAAERVSAGDLSARVEEGRASDELGTLTRAFNRMTGQIAAQRSELVEANRQLDERRRFTETVLAGVSAGVIGLDGEGRINLPNRSAAVLLSTDLDGQIGRRLEDVVPEFGPLLAAARGANGRIERQEVSVQRDGRSRTLLAGIGSERLDGGIEGFVVTFDDITALQTAQRQAAWADVARRIAHEIKNPLTPIQLAAERLKRKYMAEVRSDPETFRACTETIVRQVGDIGRMVDEFSSFARMPSPVMREEDLTELVRQTIFLQRQAHQDIVFDMAVDPGDWRLSLDQRQIGQALTNLLQNAIDAIAGRDAPADGAVLPPGRIEVRVAPVGGCPAVSVSDNGRGLPQAQRERLTEPYVTTRAKGTGLGLAIVKKIMEDHAGELRLEDGPAGGARVTLVFGAGPRPAVRARVADGT